MEVTEVWATKKATCEVCTHIWIAVYPVTVIIWGDGSEDQKHPNLECPNCHKVK
jgi:hypothetical protein